MKTKSLLAATAFATLLPTAAFAHESGGGTATEKRLQCRIGNGKGASYGKSLHECLKARARGDEVQFVLVDVPVKLKEKVVVARKGDGK
jgi:hypothetical protein